MDKEKLRPATADEIVESIAFALRYEGRNNGASNRRMGKKEKSTVTPIRENGAEGANT